MTDLDRKFWPYRPQLALAATALSLIGLLLAIAILRAISNWPSPQSETVVLIGVLLLSLLPIVLALLDFIIERGGTIEYGNIKIDFSRGKEKGTAGITVAPSIGVQGQPLSRQRNYSDLGHTEAGHRQ